MLLVTTPALLAASSRDTSIPENDRRDVMCVVSTLFVSKHHDYITDRKIRVDCLQ